MRPHFKRAAPNHVGGHVEDDGEPDVSDPAMPVEQPRNKARSDAHQNDGEPKPEDQRERMVARGARHRQHVVERHGDVRNNDLPGSLREGLPGDVALLPSQCSLGFVPVRAAQVAPHLPAHPKQQYSACQKQTDNLQKLQGDARENESQHGGSDNADEDRARALFGWQARGGKADDNRIVAREDEIDHDDLEKRGECAVRKKVELSHPLRSWMGACPMNSRPDSISRRSVAATMANAPTKSRVSTDGDVSEYIWAVAARRRRQPTRYRRENLNGAFGP